MYAQTIDLIDDPLVTSREACRRLRVPDTALTMWRNRRPGYGPRAMKVGQTLRYRASDLNAWITKQTEGRDVDAPANSCRVVHTLGQLQLVPKEPSANGRPDPLMTIDEVSAYLSIPKATLYTWRSTRPGFGPYCVYVGGLLRFRRGDVNAWVLRHLEPLSEWPS